MKRVLVTGARGFIGRHLTRQLCADGLQVVALTRSADLPREAELQVVVGDVCEPATLVGAVDGCDTVFHLAAHVHAFSGSATDDAQHQRVNVDGTRSLVEAAAAGGVGAFVFFSSVKAMGERTVAADDESVPARPETAYGRSKLAAEELLLAASEGTAMRPVCLRLPLVYGVGNKGNLSRMIDAVERHRFPPLPDTANKRSMVHVDNVVQAALLAARSEQARGPYIVTDGAPYSTRELYVSICHALGREPPTWAVPYAALRLAALAGDVVGKIVGRRAPLDSDALDKLLGTAWYSCDRIASEIGYRPSIDLVAALPEIVSWRRGSRAC